MRSSSTTNILNISQSEEKSILTSSQYKSEQGSNYDSNLSTTEIAKKLREYIKVNYPGYKFSVRSEYFSGGSCMTTLQKLRVVIQNDWTKLYELATRYYGDENVNDNTILGYLINPSIIELD